VQLAAAIGADRAEGLELQLRFFSGGPLALRDLNDHNSDFSVVGLPAIASARADKMAVLSIGQLSQAAMVSLIVRRDLKLKVHSIKQLKGLRVGVNTSTRTARSTSQMLTEYLIKRAGLNASDVDIIPAGQSREAQRSALLSKTVDALMGDEPFASELEMQGQAFVLIDLYNPQKSSALLGGPFVHAALATREDVASQFPETVRRVQRMFDHTLQWLAQHSPEETLAKLSSQPGFDEKHSRFLLAVLQRNPKMFPEQLDWNPEALNTTEKFFNSMSKEDAEANLNFNEFIRDVHLAIRP
jgi:ABC-type nitrate/sulfonate/bicarbonate transport system substrate-binding protein